MHVRCKMYLRQGKSTPRSGVSLRAEADPAPGKEPVERTSECRLTSFCNANAAQALREDKAMRESKCKDDVNKQYNRTTRQVNDDNGMGHP